ncbi:hypothetical protein I302_100341 [Kwoniella bestiolae CBS 10118]|uniref:Uncharacterized protein n=1 Tax=Kwoniella bestiolae CBS 10118 TaxID=1296100 RepID=A0A1B9G4U4_9TREE|nr:hypothetical protein I302_03713 [Kwoniella bestiolae CBS 10118]OCF26036.1 hypothetical protein I302_03713 [Kwoniella bestiolae CBS 10118]
MPYSSISSLSEYTDGTQSVRLSWERDASSAPSIASSATSAASRSASTGVPGIYFNPNISDFFSDSGTGSPWQPLSRSVDSAHLAASVFGERGDHTFEASAPDHSSQAYSTEFPTAANTATSSAIMISIDESAKSRFEDILNSDQYISEPSPPPSTTSIAQSMWNRTKSYASSFGSSIARAFSNSSPHDRNYRDSNLGIGRISDFEQDEDLESGIASFLGSNR